MKELIRIDNGVTRHPSWRMAEPLNMVVNAGEQIAIAGDNAAGKSRLVETILGHYPLLMNEVKYDFSPSPLKLVSDNMKYISFRDSYGETDGTYYYQQRWNRHDIDDSMPTAGALLQAARDQAAASILASGMLPADIEAENQRREQLWHTLVSIFKLDTMSGKFIISLSSGELRKFQIARALLSNPRVLVMDNPFIGLDAATRDLLREVLETLTSELGLTVILVLSKTDDIPTFITHVLPVEGLSLKPKQTRQEYVELHAGDTYPGLDAARRQWIEGLPAKQLGTFYPQSGGEVLNFHDISIRYGKHELLSHLSWCVHEGERWAVSGENGSGKSTLLSLVCADNTQSYACDIELFGHRRGSGESIWEIKRHIGYVSPEMHRAYLKNLPAIDIVASGLNDSVGLYTRPKPSDRQVCMDWMNVFGIVHLADETFLKLSSGEQRLCLLARAFVKNPELLILDEPLHGLDNRNRKLVRDVIEAFCRQSHKTLVMVTHYAEELPSCITHHLYLKKPNNHNI